MTIIWQIFITVFVLLVVFAAILIPIILLTKSNDEEETDKTNDGYKVIAYPNLGNNGRLGNQLFQIATTLAIANTDKSRRVASFPDWKYKNYFAKHTVLQNAIDTQNSYSKYTRKNVKEAHSDAYTYKDIEKNINTQGINLDGYFINRKYFQHCSHVIRDCFELSVEYETDIITRTEKHTQESLKENVIGVHVRRGDYVNNKEYNICDVTYFTNGIAYFRQAHPDLHVLFISDDITWCKKTFKDVDNSSMSPFTDEMDDFVCLKNCKYKVISNSTFAWWASWLNPRVDGCVYAPYPWARFSNIPTDDVYCKEWHVVNVESGDVVQKGQYTQNYVALGAYYQCYKQPKAFISALRSYRRIYPNTSIEIVSDNGTNYEQLAAYFNVANYNTVQSQGGNGKSTLFTDVDKTKLYIRNFLQGAQNIKEDFFVLLEDDVCVQNPLTFSALDDADIIGCNRPGASFKPGIISLVKKIMKTPPKSFYYGGCGGSIFKTRFWKMLDMKHVDQLIDKFGIATGQVYHSDVLLSFLCIVNGGTIKQPDFRLIEEQPKHNTNENLLPSIIHQYKDHYDTKLSTEDAITFGIDQVDEEPKTPAWVLTSAEDERFKSSNDNKELDEQFIIT